MFYTIHNKVEEILFAGEIFPWFSFFFLIFFFLENDNF